MAWGIVVTALTLFGMLVLTVASLLLDDAAADQKPVHLAGPDPASSPAQLPPGAEPAAHPSTSRKAA